MKIQDLLEKTNWKLLTENLNVEIPVQGVFVGDLLSWVMGNSEPKQAWVTVQAHSNVLAVAALRELSCIIICQGAQVNEDMLLQANTEKIPVIGTELSAFEVCRILIDIGI